MTSDNRPNPLGEIAAKIGPAWGALSGVLVALVPLGIMSQTQVDAIDAAGDSAVDAVGIIAPIVGGVVALVLAAVQSFVQAKASKGRVTPVESPRDNAGNVLVPAGPPRAIGEHRLDG